MIQQQTVSPAKPAPVLMTKMYAGHAPAAPEKVTTNEMAAILRVRPQTIRAGVCRKGHYLGLRPLKLDNRKLLWDVEAVRQLLSPLGGGK